MRYFFHVTGENPQFDKEGQVFLDPADATTHANNIAREMRAKGATGMSVIVIDENGKMHLGLPIN